MRRARRAKRDLADLSATTTHFLDGHRLPSLREVRGAKPPLGTTRSRARLLAVYAAAPVASEFAEGREGAVSSRSNAPSQLIRRPLGVSCRRLARGGTRTASYAPGGVYLVSRRATDHLAELGAGLFGSVFERQGPGDDFAVCRRFYLGVSRPLADWRLYRRRDARRRSARCPPVSELAAATTGPSVDEDDEHDS